MSSLAGRATHNAIAAFEFYANYHGHTIAHLSTLLPLLRFAQPDAAIVWLIGDSSLDNKYWLGGAQGNAVNGYEYALDPPRCAKDVAYWMNVVASKSSQKRRYVVINAAVEESTLSDRQSKLLPHDEFVRDNLQKDDVVVCSVGGNDIALRPSGGTVCSMIGLNFFTSQSSIDSGNVSGCSMRHLQGLFRDAVSTYLARVTEKTAPRLVLPCMIYFPCQVRTALL